MQVIKNWGVVVSERWGVQEPDWPQYLVGVVDGKYIMSDEITGVTDGDGCKLVKAGSKEYKVYKKDVDSKYEAAWPGAYKNLKEKSVC
jgi:hypothetical protein